MARQNTVGFSPEFSVSSHGKTPQSLRIAGFQAISIRIFSFSIPRLLKPQASASVCGLKRRNVRMSARRIFVKNSPQAINACGDVAQQERFELSSRVSGYTISSRARYDHFDTAASVCRPRSAPSRSPGQQNVLYQLFFKSQVLF